MKTLARIGAVLSFTSFFLPGVWLLNLANGKNDTLSIIVGAFLMGIAFFAGTMLWLAGERCGSRADRE